MPASEEYAKHLVNLMVAQNLFQVRDTTPQDLGINKVELVLTTANQLVVADITDSLTVQRNLDGNIELINKEDIKIDIPSTDKLTTFRVKFGQKPQNI